jgi:hypothetical protein
MGLALTPFLIMGLALTPCLFLGLALYPISAVPGFMFEHLKIYIKNYIKFTEGISVALLSTIAKLVS